MSTGNLKTLARRYSHRIRRVAPLVFADAIILFAAYLVIYSIRLETSTPSFNPEEDAFLAIAVLIPLLSLYLFGGYQRIWSKTSGHEVQILVGASGFSTAILLVLDLIIIPRPMPLSVLLVSNLIAMNGFVAVRYQSRLISGLRWRWRAVWHHEFPEPTSQVLIIGAGDAGQMTAWRLKHRTPERSPDYNIIGFIDDDPEKQGMIIEGCRVLGTRADIPKLAEDYQIDLIIVAIHNIDGKGFRDILNHCEQTKARIKIVPDVFSVLNSTNGVPPLRDVQAEDLLGRQSVGWHASVDASIISHKTILVTGAAGSIGSELCRQLLIYQPVKLILLDNNESGLHDLITEIKTEQNKEQIVSFLADITHRRTMRDLFETYRPQVVFHSAAYKHVPVLEDFPNEAVRVNIGGTQQVAGLARDYGAERFVLISTDKAVNPSSIMGASKRICELLMHALSQQRGHHTMFTSVRFGNVLGSRGSVVPTFNRQIEAGGPVTVTDPEMTRYFMTIPEAVNLVIHAACLTKGDDLFMLLMGEVVHIVDLAERMIRLRGLVPNKDIKIEFVGVRPGEKLHEELYTDVESAMPTIHPYIVELISRTNGLQPVSFSDTLNALFQTGLDYERPALDQLQEIIALGISPPSDPVS